ncbi:LacI family transcriptional regulator [Spongiactinospora gelatinilytica]|uniref:LacI family transcriptional regulator n=1 Tax=Spongiactinospora gelatinilytica TaxID=2666298 RepID=A0A2W2F609_9ACTN|nr:LacI family DNA-binding transcriptional regulator [Spongiactinospora gelatinilytica]PZG31352.1 LacI family transcriptional regulator [Spongiactinospora gelatinilytica]
MAEQPLVRLQDVAEHAGVSLATASRMLSDPDYGGRAGLRERVLASAAELGYRPNPHARALATATSTNVGLVIHDVRDPYFATLSGGVITVAERHDLLVSIVCTHRDAPRELEYVKRLADQRMRAIILAGSALRDSAHTAAMNAALDSYHRSGGSVVSVTRGHTVGHVVDIDNAGGMRRLVHDMVALGHTSFGVIAGPLRLLTVRDRLQGVRRGLKDHGITLGRDDVVYVDLSREGGQAGAQMLMSRPEPPRCLLAIADVVAVGALSWLRANGVAVPGEVSVTGFGGIPAASDAVPSITTVELPLEQVGETAMELALKPAAPRHIVQVEGTLVRRDSVAPPH